MFALLWIIYLSNGLFSFGNADNSVFITIPQGSLVGSKMITVLHNKTYYSFKGIPYAKPMLGENKFDPPRPPEPWKGLLNATKYGEICTQYNTVFEYLEGDEDCLFLNVYSPTLTTDTCKPVMVWIHPGGFNWGQSNYDFYGADYLIERDVIVVTFNYRLGPIGFLCTNDENAPGNMGLKDQTYVLRWIRDNIKYFGGCPNKVTIFGEDAGAVSVAYHTLSPMSRGLFHRAIIQSGSPTDYWGLNDNPREGAFLIGKALGMDTQDSKMLVNFMKKLSAKDILDATSKFFNIDKNVPHVNLFFIPCAETKIEGEEQFLTDLPMNLLLAGDIADVPMMMGLTEDEGAFTFTSVLDLTELVKGENLNIREKFAVRHTLGLKDPKKISDTYQDIYKFYFNNTPVSKVTLEQMKPLVSDVTYTVQHHISSIIMNQHIKSNIYKYVFAYRSDDALTRPFAAAGNVSTHADELEYLFYSDAFSTIPTLNTNVYKMNQMMTKMWTNFAKYGDPTASMDENVNTKWKPMGSENNIMFIDLQLAIKNNFISERMSFWMSKYKHMLGKFVNMLT